MEQTVTLAKVQNAIKQLQDKGERVSRRNVLALTGGGMATVHRLMSQIEEAESHQASLLESAFSPDLQKAIVLEVRCQVRRATEKLQEQVKQLKDREDEALAALDQAEETIATLEKKLKSSEALLQQEREASQQTEAAAIARQAILDQTLQDERVESQALRALLDTTRLERERIAFQVEQREQDLEKIAAREKQLVGELTATRKRLVEVEKSAAVAKQQVQDLRKQLVKAERLKQTL